MTLFRCIFTITFAEIFDYLNKTNTILMSYPITSAIVFVDFSLWKTWHAKRIATGCLVMMPRYLHAFQSPAEQSLSPNVSFCK